MQQITVPPGFDLLVKQFCKEVIRYNPQDMFTFAADYFEAKAKGEEEGFLAKLEDRRLGRGVHQKQAARVTQQAEPVDLEPPKATPAKATSTAAAPKPAAPAKTAPVAAPAGGSFKAGLGSRVQDVIFYPLLDGADEGARDKFFESTWMQLMSNRKSGLLQYETYFSQSNELVSFETFIDETHFNNWTQKLAQKEESKEFATFVNPDGARRLALRFLAGFDRRIGIPASGFLGGSSTDPQHVNHSEQMGILDLHAALSQEFVEFLLSTWTPIHEANSDILRWECFHIPKGGAHGHGQLVLVETFASHAVSEKWKISLTLEHGAESLQFRGGLEVDSLAVTQLEFYRGFDNRPEHLEK